MTAKWLTAMGVGAVAIAIGVGAASAATSCMRQDEKMAIEVRAMQTDMMVAALSCNASREYNEFVTRFKSVLNNHTHTLNGLFARIYGRGGDREYLRYTTELANQASLASVADMNGFCESSVSALRQVVTVTLQDFESFVVGRKAFASNLGPTAAIGVCKTVSANQPKG